ncbi:mitochondrial Rho GTPase [Brevipalpus obovatus]|uniref:mitochondrial Rho GTPase n=1 Tax=Brevipalpus obovatus TaxID=246614 RepID=UPI003D9EBACA
MGKSNGKKDVRILLVGDPGVGKTSLIYSLISEEFPDSVPPRADEITIPPDVTPEKVNTLIADYSAQEQDEEALASEMRKSDVICVVYSMEDDESIERVTTHWLPLIRDHLGEDHNVPVILVGNKADLVEYSSLEMISPIMNQFSEVETCVECSARSLRNISELFYYAQKAVLHPVVPLYSSDERDLTDKCKKALSRVFKLCDQDNDGLLNDKELNRFQKMCFNSSLQTQTLEDVKNIIKRSVSDGIFDNSMTLSGFLFLHCLFIQRGRHETTWTALRKFGYNDRLEPSQEYLHPPLEIPPGCSCELTLTGLQFITHLFNKYDMDQDSLLSPAEISNLFSVCPTVPAYFLPEFYLESVPINNNVKGWLDLHAFRCLWILMTNVDVKKTMELLAYLGYNEKEDNQLSAIHVTRDKRIDLQKRQTTRTVFCCHVIGPKDAGKSSFLKSFLCKSGKNPNIERSRRTSNLPKFAINSLKIHMQEKHLILREVDILQVTDNLSEPELICDVICMMYDASDPNSFRYIASIFLKHFKEAKIPVLVVSAKSDKNTVIQYNDLQPIDFCSAHQLPVPVAFTTNNPIDLKHDVYVKLGTMAAYPNLRKLIHSMLMRPSTNWVSHHLNAFQTTFTTGTPTLVKAGVGLATLALVSIFLVRLVKSGNLTR